MTQNRIIKQPAIQRQPFIKRLFKSLPLRLMAAFGLALLITLCISIVALILVLRGRPVDTDGLKLDLASIGLQTRQSYLEELRFNRELRRDPANQSLAFFQEQADLHEVRILILDARNSTWVFDSQHETPGVIRTIDRAPLFGNTRLPEGQLFSGRFVDEDNSEWIYVEQGLSTSLGGIVQNNENREQQRQRFILFTASPAPQQTYATAIEEAREAGLFQVLIQASLIGMGVALLFSFLIVRWISNPLREMSASASKLAAGDYATRTPISGPDEIRTVAITFNEMAHQVELTRQAQQDFLANISHDLRTPLTSIQGFAQAIAEGITDENGTHQAAEIIQSESGRLNRMVNDLLDLARIQAGRMDFLRQAVELHQVLQTVGHSLEVKARDKGVKLHLSIPYLPRIAGDGDRLAQVFTNLVDNAIKHTDSGGEVWFHARLDEETHGIFIHIRDTGEGIPAEDLPRIFERFYQVDKSRRQGTGLGLAITYEIVLAHNGKISVESEIGEGTQFSVWLPQAVHQSQETVLFQR